MDDDPYRAVILPMPRAVIVPTIMDSCLTNYLLLPLVSGAVIVPIPCAGLKPLCFFSPGSK